MDLIRKKDKKGGIIKIGMTGVYFFKFFFYLFRFKFVFFKKTIFFGHLFLFYFLIIKKKNDPITYAWIFLYVRLSVDEINIQKY